MSLRDWLIKKRRVAARLCTTRCQGVPINRAGAGEGKRGPGYVADINRTHWAANEAKRGLLPGTTIKYPPHNVSLRWDVVNFLSTEVLVNISAPSTTTWRCHHSPAQAHRAGRRAAMRGFKFYQETAHAVKHNMPTNPLPHFSICIRVLLA